jgi:Histidine kinase-, DNA gyrase B-, and HSP90-like ATPase
MQPAGAQVSRPSLISPTNFVLATRDTGYKSTTVAIAEFIDNSLQAAAHRISVNVVANGNSQYPIEIVIIDDGTGMDIGTLTHALTFGGSSRFNDRSSLGRYGMGLPNGALSRGRRLEVYTWQGFDVLWCCLDIDDVIEHRRRTLPPVAKATNPPFERSTPTGTVVRLLRCDRIEYKRPSTLVRRLEEDLGRIYRRFLGKGLDLCVNGRAVMPVDPLFLQRSSKMTGGKRFGDVLTYQVPSSFGIGRISVTFSELPIDRWHALPSEAKRELGVTNAPCVSVVRADREIDRGWFFMGAKRRENYDDWWRCEVSFDPVLDELFGITHAKQAISPRHELLEILVPDLESIARALNTRVRQRFELVKAIAPLGAAEKQASRAEPSLPSMPRRWDAIPDALRELVDDHGLVKTRPEVPYQIIASELPTTSAFEVLVRGGQLVLLLNARHPLYRDVYGPLAMSDSTKDQDVAKQIALSVLAAARAEVDTWRQPARSQARQFRQTWADVLATFLNA